MIVQLECNVKMCVLLEYLDRVLQLNVWASIIQPFQLPEYTPRAQ